MPSETQLEAADGVRLTIRRLATPGAPRVLLLHGLFGSGAFWLDRSGRGGLAGYLATQGYDVWLADFRGHGQSAPPSGSTRCDDFICEDVPCFIRHVADGQARVHVVGHSYGGVFAVGALARLAHLRERVATLSLVGAQVEEGQMVLRLPPVAWALEKLVRRVGLVPIDWVQRGYPRLSGRAVAEMIRWKRGWVSGSGLQYHEEMKRISAPTLAVYSDGDRTDPAVGCRRFAERLGGRVEHLHLGLGQGHQRDYSHPGMIRHPAASSEVWPALLEFLQKHSRASVLRA